MKLAKKINIIRTKVNSCAHRCFFIYKKKRRKRKVCKLVSVVGIILYCFVNHAYENSLHKNIMTEKW